MNTAQQIAADIRAEALPGRLPAHMETRLEALIDAALAPERAKVAALTEAAELALSFLNALPVGMQGTVQEAAHLEARMALRAALFDLQA